MTDYTALKQQIEQKLSEHGVEVRWVPEHSEHKYRFNTTLHGFGPEIFFFRRELPNISPFDQSTPLRDPGDIVDGMIGDGGPDVNVFIATIHDVLLFYTPDV